VSRTRQQGKIRGRKERLKTISKGKAKKRKPKGGVFLQQGDQEARTTPIGVAEVKKNNGPRKGKTEKVPESSYKRTRQLRNSKGDEETEW